MAQTLGDQVRRQPPLTIGGHDVSFVGVLAIVAVTTAIVICVCVPR